MGARTIRSGPPVWARLSPFNNVRMRLTLWYLAALALVFLVFSVILVSITRQNEDAAQRKALTTSAQLLISSYDPTAGVIRATTTEAQQLKKPEGQRVVALGYPLPPQGIALLLDTKGAITQAIGAPLTPEADVRLQAYVASRARLAVTGAAAAPYDTYATIAGR